MSGPAGRSGVGDGWARVSGGAAYVSDVRVPGALHVAFVHSPVPHARIAGVSLEAARALPGVVDVITAEQIGEILLGRALHDYPVLAAERVLFAGQRVAAVAALDKETARAAAALVEIDYAELPALLGLDQAMAEEQDVLHPRYEQYRGAVAGRAGPNTQGVAELSAGPDIERAFASADRVVETEFHTARSHSAPLEPHACVVSAGPGGVDLWATSKEPFGLRRRLAEVAGLPIEDVRVHLAPIGGDFGAKGYPFVEVACYLLAARTGRPVRHTMSYFDVLTSTSARHPLRMRLRTAVTNGLISALEADTALDGGAFGAVKATPAVVVAVVHAPFGSYAVPNRRERCVSYYSNTLPGGHVRSPGEFQALFASESQVDIIAAELGVDPVEFRLANAANDRVRRVVEELRTVVERWRVDGPADSGIGVALCFRDTGAGQTTVRAVAGPDGVEIQLSVVDQGAGSYAVFRRLAAETLGVAPEAIRIRPVTVGADAALRDAGAGASRVTAVAGRAVLEACRALGKELGDPPLDADEDLDWVPGRLAELGRDSVEAEGHAEAGRSAPAGVDIRSHGAVAVQLSVDRETGQLTLHRALLVADTGRVINEITHRGQLEGGFIYGLSQTLLEELAVEDGMVVTASLGDYRIASAADVPPLQLRVLEPHPDCGDTILSVGELANVGVAPAVANAVADAVGVRILELPLTPERVLNAIDEAETRG